MLDELFQLDIGNHLNFFFQKNSKLPKKPNNESCGGRVAVAAGSSEDFSKTREILVTRSKVHCVHKTSENAKINDMRVVAIARVLLLIIAVLSLIGTIAALKFVPSPSPFGMCDCPGNIHAGFVVPAFLRALDAQTQPDVPGVICAPCVPPSVPYFFISIDLLIAGAISLILWFKVKPGEQ
mgnify:CR=1 FL=1